MLPPDVLSEPAWQRLTWTLLHFLWQGLAVSVVAAMSLRAWPVRVAHHRYLIYLSALIVMAACPLVTFVVVDVPGTAAVAGLETTTEAGGEVSRIPGAVTKHSPIERPVGEDRPPLGVSVAASDVEDSAHALFPRTWEAGLRQTVDAMQPYAMMAWIVGVLLLAMRLSLSWLHVRWLAWSRRAIPVDRAARAAMLGNRLGLKNPPCVCVSDKIRGAIVVGLWRPLVLLPASWLTAMTPEMLDAVIAHELAHVRRFDLWVNLLQRFVETLLFYHPAVWWLSRRVSVEREMCADEVAVGATSERLVYATTLEQLGRLRLGQSPSQFGAGIGGKQMVLLDRVGNILGLPPSAKRNCRWPAGLLALAVPLVIGALAGYMALASEPEEGHRRRSATESPGGDRVSEGTPPDRTAELLRKFEAATHAWQQLHIAKQIVELGDRSVMSSLLPHLDADDEHLRCNAGFVVAKLGDDRGLNAIISELKTKKARLSQRVKSDTGKPFLEERYGYYAIHVLGKLRDRNAVPVLIEFLEREEEHHDIEWALGEIGDDRAIPALKRVLNHVDPHRHLWAGCALAKLGDPLGIPTVAGFLKDPLWTTRRHAVEGFQRCSPS